MKYSYFAETFKPLKLLRNIDLFFNPKLFQPGVDTCIPPIATSFSMFKTTSKILNLGIISLISFLSKYETFFQTLPRTVWLSSPHPLCP